MSSRMAQREVISPEWPPGNTPIASPVSVRMRTIEPSAQPQYSPAIPKSKQVICERREQPRRRRGNFARGRAGVPWRDGSG
jgi:hypothetical protein